MHTEIDGEMKYGPLREKIEWKVELEGGESKRVWLKVIEEPFVIAGSTNNRIPTPLRIVDSSHQTGEVYKLSYPEKASGLARKDDDNTTPNKDERSDPATPPADWDTKVEAKEK